VAKHYLYRHFDADGRLLYVGISFCAVRRNAQHQRTALWFPDVRTITIEELPSKSAAVAAERRAITRTKPSKNRKAGKPLRFTLAMVLRLAPGTFEQIDLVLKRGETRADLVRAGLERELRRRQPASEASKSRNIRSGTT